MKFTRDLCWLLGLGGDGPGEQEMEVQDGATNQTDRRNDPSPSQAMLSGEEGLDDEEKTRRRAERRRAKKKRQKERKKMEKGERMEDASEQEEEAPGAGTESDSEEPESDRALTITENKSNRQLPCRASEEEPEWDVSSAFVAKAASHIKLKSPKSRASQFSRENKENEAQSSQEMETTEEMKRRGEALTVQGIQMFQQGQFSQAVHTFTEAIDCDPKDHRFYGNRSYCYLCLEQYSSALTDARRSIRLAPDWPKGHFRKGCALMGLKRYIRAEEAMAQVLRLDQHCQEASSRLFTCRVLQLMELGFSEQQSELLLEKFKTIHAAINSPDAKTLMQTSQQEQSGSCRSLWVGNITVEVTEQHLMALFKMFGEIESIRVLHERFCAFVNFKNANMAAKALEKLQGAELGNCKLVMRYPDRWIQRTLPTIQRTNTGFSSNAAGPQQGSVASWSKGCAPIDGDKCFYWRTTGCFYGDKCRLKHLPEQQGQDKKNFQL
ncbi:STI1-like protein [Notolabrus celidotus]|uniref:STI1-like protein n=1 Tax=Notolabrus celidotus TaxID=1203425 RepID=UPI00148F782E|nr:STI1-like protein [Notolabrus celidotus]